MRGTEGEEVERPRPVLPSLPELGYWTARRHRRILWLLVAVGLLRGLFWVVFVEVWNPIDEAAHFAYVESLATGEGIPEVDDRVSPDVLDVAKRSPTYFFLSSPIEVDDPVATWGPTALQYEGVQGPLYYLAMVPAYWVGRPFGFLSAVYAVRIATIAVSLLAVPIAYALARRLFPRRPHAWLAAPAVLVMVNGFNANLASVTNDSLLVVLAGLSVVLFVRLFERVRPRDALLAGVVFGAAVATKTTALGLVPLLTVFFVWVALTRRHSPLRLAAWAALYGLAAAVAVAPWLAFNLATYDALTAAEAVEEVTGELQQETPFGIDGLSAMLEGASTGFWELQARVRSGDPYALVFTVAALVALIGGAWAARSRGDRRGQRALGWLAFSFPSAFIVLTLIVHGVFGGTGVAIGRHYYAALIPLAVLVAAGMLQLGGPRWGVALLALVLAVAAWSEIGFVEQYASRAFTRSIYAERSVPVIEQPWGDDLILVEEVRATAPCPVDAVSLAVAGTPPRRLSVAGSRQSIPARFRGMDGVFAVYALEEPVEGGFVVSLPDDTPVVVSARDRSPLVEARPPDGDPVFRAYCPHADPVAARFAQLYPPLHPFAFTFDEVLWWARAWALAATASAAAALVWAARDRRSAAVADLS